MIWQVVSLVTYRSPGEVEVVGAVGPGGDGGPVREGSVLPY